ncbi:amyloid protein-binding protein 2-like [Anopheles ziemanni]|uniref:amyloid protein-binding protein 2-like n=1 Tax=Anopheles coustani TaxID=139045 RepID=UPI0026599CD9|nr:amyloid protein-binding protein 2-like [Anopheles coustani]XP_058170288.1 amyloid protein-binding protein 2-like [Anopheles ziemanni]
MGLRDRFWPLIDLHFGRRCTEQEPRVNGAGTLYALALRALVSGFSDDPRNDRYRREIEQLPIAIRVDVLCDMCDHPSLGDALLELLADPVEFSNLVHHVPQKSAKLVCCLQWLESAQRSLPARLEERYRAIVEGGSWTDYRCGLRIGTFLADAGWHLEAASIFQLSLKQTDARSVEELTVMVQLLRALTSSGKLVDGSHVYQRIKVRLKDIYPQNLTTRGTPEADLCASVYQNFSLYHYEGQEFGLSYLYAVQSLNLLDRSSNTRLALGVFRQLARASMGQRYFSKAKVLLQQAISRAGYYYGLSSTPYAEALEDYAFYLLGQNNAACGDVFVVAQHIYLDLFGSRNLLLSLAQGNLTFGLCRQAIGAGHGDPALAYVTERLNTFRRMLGPDHRLVVQLQRLLVTIRVMSFQEGQSTWPDESTIVDVGKLRQTVDNPLPIEDVRLAFYRCREKV